ncbi:hypothetical protein DL93DRAFT_2073648 [Clavulina sp. PMI_390]|nr:hypothetical protein DL93DRAFT_2073648 [Clavulina sp. PMI_390]
MSLEFSERYVMIGVVNWDIHNRARHYLQVLDLQGERSMYIPHTVRQLYSTASNTSDDSLMIGG